MSLSVSGDPAHCEDVFTMATSIDLGTEELDGHTLKLPPAILGRIGEDSKKKTILIYGHFNMQLVG